MEAQAAGGDPRKEPAEREGKSPRIEPWSPWDTGEILKTDMALNA